VLQSIDPSLSRHQLLSLITEYRWAHTIDLGDGRFTPGEWGVETQSHIRSALPDLDFTGKRVLDTGCWDGLWSFEAERRGAAEVFASDDTRQRPLGKQPTLELASKLLGSSVRYFAETSIYKVDQLGSHDFDIALYLGIFYHLRDPLLAFAKLRRVLKDGGLLLVEGEVKAGQDISADFHHENVHCHPSNWWVPTIPCLRQWVLSSSFEVVKEYPTGFMGSHGRHLLLARAIRGQSPLYWGVDDDLHEYLVA
jgi:tRNA (mo5U34)-methyltransferase